MVVFRAQIIQAQSDMQSSLQKFAYKLFQECLCKTQKISFETRSTFEL